jgi:hypothetical protein
MPLYRLVLYAGGSSLPETASIERDEIRVGDIIEDVPGYENQRWRVIRPHIPEGATEPEPNAFNCELIV